MQNNTENSGKTPDFRSETINGLVILFYKNLLIPNAKQYSTAYILCRNLARRFNENNKIKVLDKIFYHSKIGFPIGLIQTIVFRDLMGGARTSKIYNYGYKSKSVRLGDMIAVLDEAMNFFVDTFTEICVKHDLDPAITAPMIEGLDIKKFEAGL